MLVVTSVMFTFISYWRTAAIVLCDLASTAYYIGGIVEAAHRQGRTLVHPGGHALQLRRPQRVHRELLDVRPRRRLPRRQGGDGRRPAKLSVSALMFDYILTGPISGVSAGQYLIGLIDALFPISRSRRAIEVGLRCDRGRDHRLLLAGQHPGYPRIERQGAEDHGRDDRDGRRHVRLVHRHAGGPARRKAAAADGPRPLEEIAAAPGEPKINQVTGARGTRSTGWMRRPSARRRSATRPDPLVA